MPRILFVHWFPKLLISMFAAHGPLQLVDTAGVSHQPLEMGNHKAAVLIFVGVNCPISNSYVPELNRIIAVNAAKGFDFYFIYSDPDLSIEAAKRHAKDFGYSCPGLVDHQQRLMKKVAATVTPEVAVVDSHGLVLYEGRIDNRYADFGKQRFSATTHELKDALDSIYAGKKIKTPVTKAVGCPI